MIDVSNRGFRGSRVAMTYQQAKELALSCDPGCRVEDVINRWADEGLITIIFRFPE